MFKNIGRYGISRDINGNKSISHRVISPIESNNKSGIVASALGSKLLLQEVSNNNPSKIEAPAIKDSSSYTGRSKKSLFGNKYKVTSDVMPGYGSGNVGSSTSGTALGSATPYNRILEGIINEDDWITKRKIYRDIYTYDLAGAVVDLFANLPYSDFNLVNISDKDILDVFNSSISNLPLQSLLPAITVDYLVNGAFLGSLDYREGKFKYLFPHNLDDATIYDINLYIEDPIVDIQLPLEIRQVLEMKGDPRVDTLIDKLPDYIKNGQNDNEIKLEPRYTLYIPRGGMSTANMGSSFFNRILTIHLVEKALIKGTIESAQRRQRAIMHIQAGIEGIWEPTNEELSSIANLVLAADLDPISGIVCTRNGVEFSDIKAGNDFWNWTEIFDFATSAKLEALGVNESILSGDASFNTLEAAISNFIDNIGNTRSIIADKIFSNKLFKIVAEDNGFYKDSVSLTTTASVNNNSKSYLNPLTPVLANESADGRELMIPTIQWEKQLKPKADKDYLDILTTLQEKGVPIPLRMYAAAGGENIDDLISSMKDDSDSRLKIAQNKRDLILDAIKDKDYKFLGFEEIDDIVNSILEEAENEDDSSIESYANVNGGIINNKKKYRDLDAMNNLYGPRLRDKNGNLRPLTTEMKRNIEGKVNSQINQALKNLAKKDD